MGLKNALKKIVKGGDKKEKKTEEEASEEIEKEPEEAEAETTIESEASPVPDEVEEEQAKPCRPGMGGLSKQRSFNRRGRRLQMAQEVEANLIDGEECGEKEEQENIPLKDGRRRRRGRRGEGENHDGPDDCSARHSQRSTSRSLDRASKHTQSSSLDGSSKHSNRSHSDDGEEVVMISIPKKEDVAKSNLRRSRNNSRSHSRDRLSQRASSRERPAMSRAASRERLSERMAANRSANRERGTRRNENGERMRRSSSRDRGQRRSRRGDGQDVTLQSSQADGKEVVDLSGTTKISTPAATKPDGTIEVVGEQSSSIRSSRSGVEVSSSVRSSRNEGGKDHGTGRRSTSRGRGRPDRGLAKSNHDNGDSGDRLGRSNHSTGDANEHRHRNSSGDRRRGSSRERRPRRPPRSENASADDSKPPLPPTTGETSPPPPERSPVPSTEVHPSKQQEESTTSKEERSAEAKMEIDSNTATQNTEDSNEKGKKADSVDLLNMIPYEETKAEEEATARQSVGVVFHSEEPQEGKSDEEEPTEEIADKAQVNPALALLGLLAERDTPETKEKKKDSRSPRPDNSDSGVIAKTECSPGTEVEIAQKDDLSEAVATDWAGDKDLGISLPSVKVTISVGNDNAKKDSSKAEAAADSETDPMLSLLGHIGANKLIDEKNSNGGSNTEPTVKSAHRLESSVDFFRGPKNDGASPDTSTHVSQSSWLSTNKNSADEHEFGKPNHLSNASMGNRRVVRRTKSSDGNLSGPSLPPPSLADPNERTKVRRVKRASVKKDESSDLPPPSLAPPSLAGDMMRHSNGKKVRRRKIKDGEGEEKTLAPPSLAGDLLASGGKARKVRRAKSDSGSDLLSANDLAPPSLAGDFHAAKVKKKGKKMPAAVGGADADAAAAEVGENVEKNTKLTRRQEKKAKRFNKLDDDDDDSLGGDIPVENQEAATQSRPRRGMLSKARSAANVIEKGVKVGKKSSSSRNLFA